MRSTERRRRRAPTNPLSVAARCCWGAASCVKVSRTAYVLPKEERRRHVRAFSVAAGPRVTTLDPGRPRRDAQRHSLSSQHVTTVAIYSLSRQLTCCITCRSLQDDAHSEGRGEEVAEPSRAPSTPPSHISSADSSSASPSSQQGAAVPPGGGANAPQQPQPAPRQQWEVHLDLQAEEQQQVGLRLHVPISVPIPHPSIHVPGARWARQLLSRLPRQQPRTPKAAAPTGVQSPPSAQQYAGNRVSTSKYNLATFLPVVLFEIFSSAAYLYFLLQVRACGGVRVWRSLALGVVVLWTAHDPPAYKDVTHNSRQSVANTFYYLRCGLGGTCVGCTAYIRCTSSAAAVGHAQMRPSRAQPAIYTPRSCADQPMRGGSGCTLPVVRYVVHTLRGAVRLYRRLRCRGGPWCRPSVASAARRRWCSWWWCPWSRWANPRCVLSMWWWWRCCSWWWCPWSRWANPRCVLSMWWWWRCCSWWWCPWSRWANPRCVLSMWWWWRCCSWWWCPWSRWANPRCVLSMWWWWRCCSWWWCPWSRWANPRCVLSMWWWWRCCSWWWCPWSRWANPRCVLSMWWWWRCCSWWWCPWSRWANPRCVRVGTPSHSVVVVVVALVFVVVVSMVKVG